MSKRGRKQWGKCKDLPQVFLSERIVHNYNFVMVSWYIGGIKQGTTGHGIHLKTSILKGYWKPFADSGLISFWPLKAASLGIYLENSEMNVFVICWFCMPGETLVIQNCMKWQKYLDMRIMRGVTADSKNQPAPLPYPEKTERKRSNNVFYRKCRKFRPHLFIGFLHRVLTRKAWRTSPHPNRRSHTMMWFAISVSKIFHKKTAVRDFYWFPPKGKKQQILPCLINNPIICRFIEWLAHIRILKINHMMLYKKGDFNS